jgi:hypothetical protein
MSKVVHAHRPRRRKPVTAERVEKALDTLAWIMSKSGHDAHLAVPLWKRLESELERLKEEEAVIAAATSRLKTRRGHSQAAS